MRLFLSLRSDRNLMRWRQAFLLANFLTMSLLCCFSLRDYGSKRKSGKSPVLYDFLLLLTSSTISLPCTYCFSSNGMLDPGELLWCKTHDSVLSVCILFTFHYKTLKCEILNGTHVWNVKIVNWSVCLLKWRCLPFVYVGRLSEFLK